MNAACPTATSDMESISSRCSTSSRPPSPDPPLLTLTPQLTLPPDATPTFSLLHVVSGPQGQEFSVISFSHQLLAMSHKLLAYGSRRPPPYYCPSFHKISLTIPRSTSASAASIENLRSIRRNFSSAFASPRPAMYPLFRSASSKASPIRSTVSISATSPFFPLPGAAPLVLTQPTPPRLTTPCLS